MSPLSSYRLTCEYETECVAPNFEKCLTDRRKAPNIKTLLPALQPRGCVSNLWSLRIQLAQPTRFLTLWHVCSGCLLLWVLRNSLSGRRIFSASPGAKDCIKTQQLLFEYPIFLSLSVSNVLQIIFFFSASLNRHLSSNQDPLAGESTRTRMLNN